MTDIQRYVEGLNDGAGYPKFKSITFYLLLVAMLTSLKYFFSFAISTPPSRLLPLSLCKPSLESGVAKLPSPDTFTRHQNS